LLGNIFISCEVDSRGRKKPILTLLDHGLYQDLSDELRLNYSYLWKGMKENKINVLNK